MSTVYRPEWVYVDEAFKRGELLVGRDGRVMAEADASDPVTSVVEMPGKAMVPGFVNAHSHSFQRLIRGKSESRVTSGNDFWSWRGTMYHAASRLDPQQVYDVARMAFLEMLLAGTTTVGEFHYLHTMPDGQEYEDPNLLGRQVMAAARSVGIRIVLLRTAYLRSGFEVPRDVGQTRFFETGEVFLRNMDALVKDAARDARWARIGVAPHSVRAVPLGELKEITSWTRAQGLPLHMHVAEQVAENAACVREYGRTPVEMLASEGILGEDFTAVHAVHVTDEEIAMLAKAGAMICSCPTTERNLGDGIVRAHDVMSAGIAVAFGSDSQAQIDPLEDARELEYHLRLQQQQRAVLDQIEGKGLAARLLASATKVGARALKVPTGSLRVGEFADFFTVDLKDMSIAGASEEDLLPILVFAMERTAIRDVVVNGEFAVRAGRHALQEEIVERYGELHRVVWSDASANARAGYI
jgi:formimidoylglutamate deiminase